MLELQKIKKSRGKKEILKGIDFSMGEGEFVALLGESGSGKTTLLRCIAGLEILDGGKVLFQGKRVIGPEGKLVPGHKSIEIVQQDFDLFANHNVFDLIEFKLRGYDDDFIKEKIAELLSLVGIPGFSEKHLYEISGGEHQRVAIAQALAGEPLLLLFDESFSHLDSRNTRTLFVEITRLIKEMGISVLFSTHQTELALAYADRIAIMREGTIVQEGTSSSIYDSPVSTYVAELFGEINNINDLVKDTTSKKKSYIRPEHIVLSDEGNYKAQVMDQRYIGGRYRVELKVTGRVIIAYHMNEIEDDYIYMSFDQQKIMKI